MRKLDLSENIISHKDLDKINPAMYPAELTLYADDLHVLSDEDEELSAEESSDWSDNSVHFIFLMICSTMIKKGEKGKSEIYSLDWILWIL